MSFPNIPNVVPKITLNQEDAVNLLLASIAFEELGLAHILNAEAEKIQFVLGTLEGQENTLCPDLDDLLALNESVQDTIAAVSKKEMILLFKLQDVIKALPKKLPDVIHHEEHSNKRSKKHRHGSSCDCQLCQLENSYKNL